MVGEREGGWEGEKDKGREGECGRRRKEERVKEREPLPSAINAGHQCYHSLLDEREPISMFVAH